MSSEEINDQLPFIQVHQSAPLKVARLSALLNLELPHVFGGLVMFWLTLNDRRLFTADAIVLPCDEITTMLRSCFFRDVDAGALVATGFLEKHENGFRVRGMSRYIEAERRRAKLAEARSAKHRALKTQSVKPTPNTQLTETQTKTETRHDHVNDMSMHVNDTSTQSPLFVPSLGTEERGERREERVDTNVRTQTGGERAAPKGPVTWAEPTEPPDTWDANQFFQWAQFKRTEAGLVGERSPPRNLSFWYSTACLELGGNVERLQDAFFRFGEDKHWQKQNPPLPFRAFVSQWDRYVAKGGDRC